MSEGKVVGSSVSSEVENSLYMKDYVDAVGESSKRTRFIAVILVLASILCFIAFWNSAQSSWSKGRVDRYNNAIAHWSLLSLSECALRNLRAKGEEEYRKYEKVLSLAKEYGYDPIALEDAGVDNNTRLAIRDDVGLIVQEDRKLIQAVRVSNVLNIRIPFFGVFFDINDLGMFSGITFMAILLMARYSFLREFENLLLFAQQAESIEDLSPYYALLATQQVLTVPPKRPGQSRFWTRLPRLVLWLPVLVLTAILVNDGLTFSHGFVVSGPRTILSFSVTGLLLAFIVVLAFSCNKYWRRLDAQWNELFKRNLGEASNLSLQNLEKVAESSDYGI